MDWLIDTDEADGGSTRALALLEEHLRRHAVDSPHVEATMTTLPDDLRSVLAQAAGRPVHLRLDWTSANPVLRVASVDPRGTVLAGQPVPAQHRASVRSWPREELGAVSLRLPRRGQRTFSAGPPPVVETVIDPESQGQAAVALALVTALEAHPSASAAQAATIAGALIANAGAEDNEPADARAAAEEFVRLHRALGSEAYVVAADGDVVELAVAKCPFGTSAGPSSPLCHVSSGLAGQLAARVRGSATVLLDETIVSGDPECHLQVLLGRDADPLEDGQSYFWPPHAARPDDRVPHLDLSVALPRESVSVPVVRRLAAQALRAFGVLDEDVDDVQLAITEACANVIDHAGATDTYEVKIELAADRCALTVVDQGSGFDVASIPEHASDDAEMGRGLTLMRALVDNVAFRNEPQAGAVVHMVKTLRYIEDHPLRGR